jgi:hypothetical protein
MGGEVTTAQRWVDRGAAAAWRRAMEPSSLAIVVLLAVAAGVVWLVSRVEAKHQ